LHSTKILLIQLRYIGDTILTTPLISALKQGLPEAKIDVLATSTVAPILSDHPYIHRLWHLDAGSAGIKFWQMLQAIISVVCSRFDVVADLTCNDRSALLTTAARAKFRIGFCGPYPFRESLAYSHVIPSVLGYGHAADHYQRLTEVLDVPKAEPHPWLHVPSDRRHKLEKQLLQEGLQPTDSYVVLHPGARRWYKCWPVERFASLGDRIRQMFHLPVIISGGKEEIAVSAQIADRMREPAVNLTAKINLADLPALIQKAVCLVGNDSAPIHIATAVGTPALALFGPTDWRVWGPRRKQDQVLAANLACCSCGHHKSDCPLDNNYCMTKISLESVWDAVRNIIGRKKLLAKAP
jgi:predicted lipopolysaccharide heptosyltransferase III